MKIVFVAPFGLGQKTTVWARILPLARHLIARRCEVTLLIPPWDTPADAGKIWTDGGVTLVNVSLRGGLPLVTARLLHKISEIRPQIIHIVKPRAYAGIVQWILWQWRQVHGDGPRLLLDVDDWEQAWSAIGGYAPWTVPFLDWQEAWGIRHADAVTAASRWLEQTVHDMTPQMPVLYLPNGIVAPEETDQLGVSRTNEKPKVLLFSRFVEVEPAWIGDFWRSLQVLAPNVQLLVAGQALQRGQEARFRTALQEESTAVCWLGYVQPSELAKLYEEVACAIFPAANVPLNQAKCSVRLATTLLHGVPVVASAVGEQANYGAHGAARLVPAGASPAEFAQGVAELLAAPADRRRLIAQARRHLLSEYAWTRLGDELYAFYCSLT
jgi:glycosyltransferase involved in cell wall biosynthesis